MNKFRNALLAALGLIVLNTVLVLYSTRNTHAAGAPVVVQVQGTASTLDVNSPDTDPVQFFLLPSSLTSSTNTATFGPIPAHKRLVIDYYSSQAQDLTGGAAGLDLGTTTNGTTVNYIVYVNKDDTDAVNQSVHICADPGTMVSAFAFNATPSSGSPHCGGLISISGHYVPD